MLPKYIDGKNSSRINKPESVVLLMPAVSRGSDQVSHGGPEDKVVILKESIQSKLLMPIMEILITSGSS